MRRHIIKTRPSSWARRGFLIEERYFLSEISRAGARAPYVQAMSRRRISLNANRVKYGWTMREYRRRVYAEYVKVGVREKGKWETYRHYFKATFYDYFTAWKERTPLDPEWETPRKKRLWRVKGEPRAQTTKRKMLQAKVVGLNDKITRAMMRGDQAERRRLESERNRYQMKLDTLR